MAGTRGPGGAGPRALVVGASVSGALTRLTFVSVDEASGVSGRLAARRPADHI